MDGPGWPLSPSREMVSTTHADAGLMPAVKLLQSLVFPVFHPSGATKANPLSASWYAPGATGRPPGAQNRNQNHPAAAPTRPIALTMPLVFRGGATGACCCSAGHAGAGRLQSSFHLLKTTPHCAHSLAPSGFTCWHFGHFIQPPPDQGGPMCTVSAGLWGAISRASWKRD